MKKIVFLYYGSDISEGATKEEKKASMDKWMAWFGTFNDKMVDGGNPFAPDGKSVSAKGVKAVATDVSSTGYTIINVKDIHEAVEIAKGCPLAKSARGAIHVYETMPM